MIPVYVYAYIHVQCTHVYMHTFVYIGTYTYERIAVCFVFSDTFSTHSGARGFLISSPKVSGTQNAGTEPEIRPSFWVGFPLSRIHTAFQESYNTPLEHIPGNPLSQL